MDKWPLITVVIPVYNGEKYIRECLESIIRQTYHNLEILIINDGSTDNTLSICEEYLNDERVVIHSQLNGGLSYARNEGIRIAKGEYITFIDGDDSVNYNMIEVLFERLNFYCADIACCNFKMFYDCSDLLGINNVVSIKNEEELSCAEAITRFVDDIGYKGYAWNKLFKIELIKNIYFPVGQLYEDIVFNVQAFHNTEKIIYIDSELYYYRVRFDSISKSQFSDFHYDIVKSLHYYEKYINKNFNKEYDNITAGYVSTYLHFVGKALKSNIDIKEYIIELKQYIQNNMKSIMKAKRMFRFKKIQILVFYYMPISLYKLLYTLAKKINK